MKTLRTLLFLTVLCLGLPAMALAQNGNDSTEVVTASLKAIHDITADFVLATAEMLDEEMYAYRPTVTVRTTGQILAHIANAQFSICSIAAGEENPSEGNYEEIATTRADILAAVKASFAYCEGVYAAMTDAKGLETKPFFSGSRRRAMTVSSILSFNSTHTYEHYGNLTTYMRLNGIVPPSSQ